MRLEILEDQCFRRPLTEQEVSAAWETPPYWAFCWASGQAMARYIFDHADQFIGKKVIDFGPGSGVAGVAAAMVGAQVVAVDIDPQALIATNNNARLNGVEVAISSKIERVEMADILLAADVLYDPSNFALLDEFPRWAAETLIADSRIRHFDHKRYVKIDEIRSVTLPDLDELELYRRVSFYRSTET